MIIRRHLLLTGALLAMCGGGGSLAAAPEQELESRVKQTTDELTKIDKTVAAARTALLAARESLDTARFNSAAFNARLSAKELAAAREKLEKAAPDQKTDAQEVCELAQELDGQRQAAFGEAQKLLPQRETEEKAALEKYAAVLAVAEEAAGQMKDLVRHNEDDAEAKLKDSKLATEKAAIAKADAEQKAVANAAIVKTLGAVAAADKALVQTATALKQATDNDRPQKTKEAENAAKAFLMALHTAVEHLPALQADKTKAAGLMGLQASFSDADGNLEKASAALQKAKKNAEEKSATVKQTEDRIKAAREGMEKRIAKIRAGKDLGREEEALKRAQAAKIAAEQALPAKTADADKAQQAQAAAMQAAVQALVLAPDPAKALADDKAAVAKAVADREAELKKENEALVQAAGEAQKAADKARADWAAADKATSGRIAAREALLKVMRQRFLRDIRAAYDERTPHEAALAAANKELQAKITACNQTGDVLKKAKEHLANVEKGVAATATTVTNAAKDKAAAEKLAQEKTAAKTAAEQKAAETLAAAKTAKDNAAAAPVEGKAAAEAQAKDREAAAQAAAGKAGEAAAAEKSAAAALEKCAAALSAAEKRAAESARSAKETGQKAATAQAAVDKAAAERNAIEQKMAGQRKDIEAASIRVAEAQAQAQGGLSLLPATEWDLAKARHLLMRAGFGGTPDEVAKLHALGLHGAVRYLVDFKKQPASAAVFAPHSKEQPLPYETALSGEAQRLLRQQRAEEDRQQLQSMRVWWLRRMIESPRPLEEKLTLFWHGQIPVQYSTVGDSYYMYLQNQMFRANAAGNFGTLLYGVAHDAAMLKYLNNDTNVKGRANENLAREIMELFSMGRDQGYTENDIRQGARALTGYTYNAANGQFRFLSDRHDTEPKTIFGKTGGYSGDDFVRLILETPHPAKFIARQLFTFFAHDDPSPDTVEALATVLRANNYDIAPMLENLFLSGEFYSARTMGTEVKSPVQLLVGLHRDLGLKDADFAYLANALRDMGQDLFEPPSVFGWQPGRSWITTSRILGRYNVVAEVLEKRPRAGRTGVDVVGGLLAGKTFKTHDEVVDYLVRSLWVVPLPDAKRQALVEFLKPLPEPAQWSSNAAAANARLTRLLSMLLCAPESQLG